MNGERSMVNRITEVTQRKRNRNTKAGKQVKQKIKKCRPQQELEIAQHMEEQ